MSGSIMNYQEYGYHNTAECCTVAYLLPEIFALAGKLGPQTRVLYVGCGNGFTAGHFAQQGCQVVGIDLSESDIALSRQAYPQTRVEVLAADADVLKISAKHLSIWLSAPKSSNICTTRALMRRAVLSPYAEGGDLSARRLITAI